MTALNSNPVTGALKISITNAEIGPMRADVFDESGRIVYDRDFVALTSSTSFNLSGVNLPSGKYFLRISNDHGIAATEFTIIK